MILVSCKSFISITLNNLICECVCSTISISISSAQSIDLSLYFDRNILVLVLVLVVSHPWRGADDTLLHQPIEVEFPIAVKLLAWHLFDEPLGQALQNLEL